MPNSTIANTTATCFILTNIAPSQNHTGNNTVARTSTSKRCYRIPNGQPEKRMMAGNLTPHTSKPIQSWRCRHSPSNKTISYQQQPLLAAGKHGHASNLTNHYNVPAKAPTQYRDHLSGCSRNDTDNTSMPTTGCKKRTRPFTPKPMGAGLKHVPFTFRPPEEIKQATLALFDPGRYQTAIISSSNVSQSTSSEKSEKPNHTDHKQTTLLKTVEDGKTSPPDVSENYQSPVNHSSINYDNNGHYAFDAGVHPMTSGSNRLKSFIPSPKIAIAGLSAIAGFRILLYEKLFEYLNGHGSRPLAKEPLSLLHEKNVSHEENVTIEVYVDSTSIGSTNQVIDIIESHSKNPNHNRIASWGRIEPDEEISRKLGLKFHPIAVTHIPQSAIDDIDGIARAYKNVNLTISCTTLHSHNTLTRLIKLTQRHPNLKIGSIVLYDDGSVDCKRISTWDQKGLPKALDHLKKYVRGKSRAKDFGLPTLYNWQHVFKDRVTFKSLRPECFTIFSKDTYLRDYLGSSLSSITWDRFSQLDEYQQNQFLRMIKFNKTKLQQQYDQSVGNNVIFVGTTFPNPKGYHSYDMVRSSIANHQIEILKNINNRSSKYFLPGKPTVFYKGHPGGGDINSKSLSAFDTVKILPNKISLETLMMTDMLPNKVFGMLSTVFFTLPEEKIGYLVYHPKPKHPRQDIHTLPAEPGDDPLVQVMLKLGLIKPENILT